MELAYMTDLKFVSCGFESRPAYHLEVSMSDDLNCPVCGAGNEVCHDDGAGYAEDQKHQMECQSCGINFVFTTSISFYYEAEEADCLNGAPHNYEETSTFPPEWSELRCTWCDHRGGYSKLDAESRAKRCGRLGSQPTETPV